jgi:hypothetical protein
MIIACISGGNAKPGSVEEVGKQRRMVVTLMSSHDSRTFHMLKAVQMSISEMQKLYIALSFLTIQRIRGLCPSHIHLCIIIPQDQPHDYHPYRDASRNHASINKYAPYARNSDPTIKPLIYKGVALLI